MNDTPGEQVKKFKATVKIKLEATVVMTIEAEDAATACDKIELMAHTNRNRIEMINSVPPEEMECEVVHIESVRQDSCFLGDKK